jgi:hypothetical protein
VDSNLFIIQFLLIYLADMSKAWLDHVPMNSIDCWEDLKEIFNGNFQGTYIQPSNPWDLKGCQQKQGDSLWDYIWLFSQKCHELPKICDTYVISVFWSGMTCRTLVCELDRGQQKTTKEAVGVVFVQNSRKVAMGDERGPSTIAADKGTKRRAKSDKRGPRLGM